MWSNPAALSQFCRVRRCGGRDPHHHAVDQVQQRRLRRRRSTSRSAAPAAMPAASISFPTCTVACRSTGSGRSASASTRRSGSIDRIRRRLDRSLPGAEVADRDDQRESGAVVEGDRRVRGRRRRQLSSIEGDASPTTSNYSGALADRGGRAAAGIAPGSPTFNAIAASTAGLDSNVEIKAERRRLGLEHRHPGRRDADHAHRRELPFGDQVRRGRQRRRSAIRHCRAAPPHARAHRCGRSRGVNSQSLQRRRHFGHHAAADRQRVDVLPAQRPLGRDGRRAVDRLVEHPGARRSSAPTATLLAVHAARLRDTWRLSAGASYRPDDQWKFRGGVAYDQTPVNDADRTRAPARRGSLVARGRRAVRVTRTTSSSTPASSTSSPTASINQNAGQHGPTSAWSTAATTRA